MYMNMYTYTYGYTYMYMPGVERRIYTYTSHWYMYIKSSPKVTCTYNLLQKRHIHTILSKRDLLCPQHLSHAHIIRHLMTMYIQSSPKETYNLLQKRRIQSSPQETPQETDYFHSTYPMRTSSNI